MKGRLAGLLALAVGEVLVGTGLRSDALLARSRAEAHVRGTLRLEEELARLEAAREAFCSPEALAWRLARRREAAAVRLRREDL